jgi:hypothetical protein
VKKKALLKSIEIEKGRKRVELKKIEELSIQAEISSKKKKKVEEKQNKILEDLNSMIKKGATQQS